MSTWETRTGIPEFLYRLGQLIATDPKGRERAARAAAIRGELRAVDEAAFEAMREALRRAKQEAERANLSKTRFRCGLDLEDDRIRLFEQERWDCLLFLRSLAATRKDLRRSSNCINKQLQVQAMM